jgi:hypothetical protein
MNMKIMQQMITITDVQTWFMVFNATFNKYFSNIVEVSFIGGGNYRPVISHRQTIT